MLAIDQGTTSSRTLLFDRTRAVVGSGQREHPQAYPHPGWVEHDPSLIWSTQRATIAEALEAARLGPADVAAIGITNQRETTLIWDRPTGRPMGPAIVWQDRRTAERCAALLAAAMAPRSVRARVCCPTAIFRRPNSSGCWRTCPAPATGPNAATSRSAPWTAGSSGISRAAAPTSRT